MNRTTIFTFLWMTALGLAPQTLAQGMSLQENEKATLQLALQKEALEMLAQDKEATGLWGLFSEGGYSNSGQLVLLTTSGSPKIWSVPPNLKKYEKSQAAITDWSELERKLNLGAALPDFDQGAFDGIQYELLYAIKEKEKIIVKSRVFMNNPQLDAKSTYAQLVDLLLTLIPTKS